MNFYKYPAIVARLKYLSVDKTLKYLHSDIHEGGFLWRSTREGYTFWELVLKHDDPLGAIKSLSNKWLRLSYFKWNKEWELEQLGYTQEQAAEILNEDPALKVEIN